MIKHTSAINKYAYYVHYFASNFVKQQSLPGSNALSTYAIQRTRSLAGTLKSGVSKQVKQEYANTIAALYGRQVTTANLTQQDITKAQNAIEQILMTQTTQFTSNDRIDWLTGRVLSGDPQGNTIQQGTQSMKQTQYLTEQQLYNLQQLINNLQTQVAQILSKNTNQQAQFANLETKLNQVQTMITQISRNVDNELRTLKGWNPGLFGADKDTSLRVNLGVKNRNLLNELNKAIKDCGLKNIVLTTAQGTLGEDVAAIAADVVSGLGLEHIDRTIKQSVVGSNWTNLEFNIRGMPADVYAQSLLAETKYQKGNVIYSKHGSQGKVDVIATLPTDSRITGFRKVNVSMKSLDLGRNIHLVSGTNLWYLIQDEGVKTFLRPYLNIIADHALARDAEIAPINISQENSAIRKIASLKQDALLATKIITAYKALSGHTFGRLAAQLFIVNDVASQQVYVLEINDIVKAILKETQLSYSSIDRYFTFEGLDDLVLKNSWQKTLDARMAGLIQDARSKKLFIAMQNTSLTGSLASKAIIA